MVEGFEWNIDTLCIWLRIALRFFDVLSCHKSFRDIHFSRLLFLCYLGHFEFWRTVTPSEKWVSEFGLGWMDGRRGCCKSYRILWPEKREERRRQCRVLFIDNPIATASQFCIATAILLLCRFYSGKRAPPPFAAVRPEAKPDHIFRSLFWPDVVARAVTHSHLYLIQHSTLSLRSILCNVDCVSLDADVIIRFIQVAKSKM